jgi:hypothetical protein
MSWRHSNNEYYVSLYITSLNTNDVELAAGRFKHYTKFQNDYFIKNLIE